MKDNQKSTVAIMRELLHQVKPVWPVMVLAVIMGVTGFLCAIFLPILGGKALFLNGVGEKEHLKNVFLFMGVLAVCRGIFHYVEQYCNHYIAFKILALLRHQVFEALKKLCPAKLEGKNRGNLITIITTDIELLEVFYAHTISPILIGGITSLIMVLYVGHFHYLLGIFAAFSYGIVGIIIPIHNGKKGADIGKDFQNAFGNLNTFVFDSLRGIAQILQCQVGDVRQKQMNAHGAFLSGKKKKLNELEGAQQGETTMVILGSCLGMLLLAGGLFAKGQISGEGFLLVLLAQMSSFGPVVALASLSNHLNKTLASARRVLALLEEEPVVKEIEGEGVVTEFTGANFEQVTFGYGSQKILEQVSLPIPKGTIIGLHGSSGTGKSTLLKLLMRFYDVDSGNVLISNQSLNTTPTKDLRNMEGYMTQETHLFHDSIFENIALAKPGATKEEVIKAAKAACIHEWIMSLNKGYDTMIGELGSTVSGGQKQRIGLARAFLQGAPLLLLDEPTSNLDALNEGAILKALKEESKGKTIVLVSHRKSTLAITDMTVELAGKGAS